MKKLLQIPLLLVALFLTSIPISAHDFSAGGIYYDIYYDILTDSTVAVTYKGSNYDTYSNEYTGAITIPSSVTYNSTTYSVTSIGEDAFRKCSGLTSVTIPNSVTEISGCAFYNCSSLTFIIIPNSVTTIGTSAFSNTPWYNNLTDGVKYINNVLYKYKGTMPAGTSIEVKDGTISISGYAFKDCTGLTSVTIPNSVTSIGDDAFSGCTGLTSVTIGNSVTSIGEDAFYKCTGLTDVTIPNSVTSIGDRAFSGCTGLTSVTIGNSVTEIGDRAFSGCTGLTLVTIPNSVTTIGSDAFHSCIGLTEVTIPNSVTSIGGSAFYNCDGLTSVTIGNSVTSIGDYAFRYCSGLTEVNFNAENCTSMGSYDTPVFSGCSNLKTINIGNEVKKIPNSAFSDCIGLTEVNFNAENCTSMGSNNFPVFSGCSNLKTINIGNEVKKIPNSAFYKCTGLTEVNFNAENCTSMGSNDSPVFSGCSNLKTINIGNEVKKIPNSAFYGCIGLTEVTIGNSVTSIGGSAFYNCDGLTSVTIPNSVTSIGTSAFYHCSGLTNLEVLASDIAVDGSAFLMCTKLANKPLISNITQTTGTISGLTSSTKYAPYFLCNNQYYKNGEKITGLTPNSTYRYKYGLKINDNYCAINDSYLWFETSGINCSLNGTANVTYISAIGSCYLGDATLVGEGLNLNSAVTVFDNKNNVTYYNLDPNTSYTIHYGVKIKESLSAYTTSKTFTTSALELATQEAKPTSTTSVRLLAATNCDATEGTGFEWRRYDAPDELPSSKVSCPVVDGVLVGSLRGVKDDVYYKYRPFYTSSSGKTYYGDWIAFFTGDANVYFEPEVRTYEDIQVINNSATVKGYALEGTDVITSQGFEYWKTGSTIKPASTDDRMTVSASGISMSATLANLEYNSTYKYRAYVTTAKGTVYGDEMEFSTGEDPSGIGYIEIDSDEFVVTLRENPATGTAWVKIAGAAGEEVQYTLTSMSGAMVANGTVLLDGEWNAIDLNCSAGMYLLTINDGTQVKTLRLIVK